MTKLFVVTHKDVYIPDNTALVPLNVNNRNGNNISGKNDYSELRAHYWVWKNEPDETDKVGFFQFRRYLDLTPTSTKLPYTIRKYPKAEEISLDSTARFDVIAPLPEYTGRAIWERYGSAHKSGDLRLVYQIIQQKEPNFGPAADEYLNGKSEYYGNLFIMRRDIFNSYCQWLFGILSEFDSLADDIPPRTQGYLAERLFGIWFTKIKTDNELKWREVPRVHYWGYDDETHHLRREKLMNLILPPGTERRAKFRRLVKG